MVILKGMGEIPGVTAGNKESFLIPFQQGEWGWADFFFLKCRALDDSEPIHVIVSSLKDRQLLELSQHCEKWCFGYNTQRVTLTNEFIYSD